MNNNDFLNYFGDIFNTTSDKEYAKWTNEDELNNLWAAYNDFVQELKDDGYKVMRNENGKHKIIRS